MNNNVVLGFVIVIKSLKAEDFDVDIMKEKLLCNFWGI
jgi:hypothetical protein